MTESEVTTTERQRQAAERRRLQAVERQRQRQLAERRRRHVDATPVELGIVEPVIYTVPEFCRAHRISRSKLYMLINDGQGPQFMTGVGNRRLVTREAAAKWRAERSQRTAD